MKREYRHLLETMRVLYGVVQHQKIVFINDWAVEHIGYSRDELIGKPVPLVIAPEERERLLRMYHGKLAGLEGDDRYETVFLTKGGRRFPAELVLWATDYGGESAVAAIGWDISERRMQTAEYIRSQEEVRKALARALHDDVIQELVLVDHFLKNTSGHTYGIIPRGTQERLVDLIPLVERAINKVRRCVDDLRPDILQAMGLVPALRWLTRRLTTQDGVRAKLRLIGEERRLPPDAEVALFRIAQEALCNVRKHAHASEAIVTFEFGEAEVAMSVSDNGKGFELPAHLTHFGKQRRFGLLGIVEWVQMLGGEYRIDTAPGKGTTVRANMNISSNSSS